MSSTRNLLVNSMLSTLWLAPKKGIISVTFTSMVTSPRSSTSVPVRGSHDCNSKTRSKRQRMSN